VPERLLAEGFSFQFGELSAALAAATNPVPR
jgi:NAD dependent epimerase/dehydratase family enzyme